MKKNMIYVNISNMINMILKIDDLIKIILKGVNIVINAEGMSSGCILHLLRDISKWDIKNVTNKSCMFFGCNRYLKVPFNFKDV